MLGSVAHVLIAPAADRTSNACVENFAENYLGIRDRMRTCLVYGKVYVRTVGGGGPEQFTAKFTY
jgi:hypothetical protein